MPLQERRRHPRYSPPKFFKAVGVFPGGREQSLDVSNISMDGLCFSTALELTRESVFVISFGLEIEGLPAARIETPAKIIWFVFDEEANLFRAGAHFLGLNDDQRKSLRQVLSQFVPK